MEKELNKERETEILSKLDSIAESLEKVKPADYTDKDIQAISSSIEEMQDEIEKLKDNFHTLDKQTATFLGKLNSLEKDIDDFEKAEGMGEENAKSFVITIVMSLATGIVTYLFAQMKSW